MIKVTLEFSTLSDMLGFFGQAKAPLAAQIQPAPGLALESGEFVPAAELNKTAAKPSPKATPAPAPAAQVEPPASSPAPAPSPAAGATLDYPTLQKAVFALAGKSREAATQVFAALGVKNAKELPETRWPEALAAVNAKLAELEAA